MSRNHNLPRWAAPALMVSLVAAAGCGSVPGLGSGQQSSAPAPAPAAAAAPAAPKGPPPGMNDRGEVVDSSKVEAGHGQKVKGLNDWEGEITGKAGPNSRFTRLQIGMSMRQAMNIAGEPSDQGAYMTGKAWIPFFFGSDRYRQELVYKGQGRLIFAGPAGMSFDTGNLIWIIHNANEPGTR